jgi:hypothetical protein
MSACKEIESACKEMRSANKLQRKITSRSVDSPSPLKCPVSDSELDDVCPNSPLKSPNKLELGSPLKKQNSERKWWDYSATVRKTSIGGPHAFGGLFRSQMTQGSVSGKKRQISQDSGSVT